MKSSIKTRETKIVYNLGNPNSRPPRRSVEDRDVNQDEQRITTETDEEDVEREENPIVLPDVEEEEERERKRKQEAVYPDEEM